MRFSGKVGFAFPKKLVAGIWEDQVVERKYTGDYKQSAQLLSTSGGVLAEKSFDTTISIVADAYALENFAAIAYVWRAGSRWSVTSVKDDQRPRLILRIGEVYHGPEPDPDAP